MIVALSQFAKYVLVGLLSNGALYLIYLALTGAGIEPKLSMSLLYAVGVAQTFLFNKRWTFQHAGLYGSAFIRYCVAYGIGYLVNLLALFVLVDLLAYPHQIVQGVMILILAVMLFMLQKFWIFRVKLITNISRPIL